MEQVYLTDSTNGLSIISHVLNISVSIGNQSGSQGVNEGLERPYLVDTSHYLGELDQEGKAPDADNVISLICSEIVSIHISGKYRNSKPSQLKQAGNGEKLPTLDPLSGNGTAEFETHDDASILTNWFLDTMERSYEFERQNSKVNFSLLPNLPLLKMLKCSYRLVKKMIVIILITAKQLEPLSWDLASDPNPE